MRLLLDSCVSSRLIDELRSAGHDVEWVGDWQRDPGDREVLAAAMREARVLITLDRDFGELAIARGEFHVGIIRLINIRIGDQGRRCIDVLQSHGSELSAGAIIAAEPGRNRIRAPPPS